MTDIAHSGWNVGVAYKSDRKILNKQTGKRSVSHVKYLQKLHTASKNTVVIKHIFFVSYLVPRGQIKISHETLNKKFSQKMKEGSLDGVEDGVEEEGQVIDRKNK